MTPCSFKSLLIQETIKKKKNILMFYYITTLGRKRKQTRAIKNQKWTFRKAMTVTKLRISFNTTIMDQDLQESLKDEVRGPRL